MYDGKLISVFSACVNYSGWKKPVLCQILSSQFQASIKGEVKPTTNYNRLHPQSFNQLLKHIIYLSCRIHNGVQIRPCQDRQQWRLLL